MKLKLLLAVLIMGLIVACSEDDKSSTGPEDVEVNNSAKIAELFPVNVGSTFTYNMDELNPSTGNYETIGSRTMSVNNKETDAETNYFYCSEAHNISSGISTLSSKFVITNNTLEIYQDTAGVSVLIPDSLKAMVQLQLSESFKLINYPYEDGNEWLAYKGEAKFGTINFKVYSILGKYVGTENVMVPKYENGIETEKFKYTISINIPDLNNPFVSNIQEYVVHLWMAKNVGIVKIEGYAVLINTLSGGSFNLSDSNKVFRHSLVNVQ